MEVPIRSRYFLEKLDSVVEEFYSVYNQKKDTIVSISDSKFFHDKKDDAKWHMTRERLDYYRKIGDDPKGVPRDFKTIPLSNLKKDDPESWSSIYQKWRYDFANDLGVKTCTLFNFYLEDNYIGWHTNHGANGYQVLFTWSKTGDGYFCYYDIEKDEIITIPDKPGWQCRTFYFGREDEPEHMCWHACYTNSERITLAYRFDNESKSSSQDKLAQNLRDDLIDEIMREE
jgi:hypothetical protein